MTLIIQIIPETPVNAVFLFILQQRQTHTHTLTKSPKIALTALYYMRAERAQEELRV